MPADCAVRCLVIFTGAGYAQSMAIAGSQRRVNPTGTIWRECSVAVRFDQPNEAVVAANNIYGEPVAVNVGFGVTFNGGSSFTHGSLGLFSDPGVVADPVTGRMWISALGCTGGIGAVYKDAGSSVFSEICCIRSFSSIDKPLMAIGADGRQYVSYSILTGNCPRLCGRGRPRRRRERGCGGSGDVP